MNTQALPLHMIATKTTRMLTMSEATHVSLGPVSIMSELTKRLVMNLVAVKIVQFLRRFECKCIKLVFDLIETKCFLGFYFFRDLFISKKWRLLMKKNV